MYKPSIYLVVTYFPTYLPIDETSFPTELVTKVKPNINSVEVHPQLSKKRHLVDGALVSAGSLWLHLWALLITWPLHCFALQETINYFFSFFYVLILFSITKDHYYC